MGLHSDTPSTNTVRSGLNLWCRFFSLIFINCPHKHFYIWQFVPSTFRSWVRLCGFHTPSHKQLIPESERPFLEINFFLRFSVRLSGNNRSRVISMGDFGPTASNFCYDFWQFFVVKIIALVRKHLKSWTGFDLTIILGVKFWWFSFFLLPL